MRREFERMMRFRFFAILFCVVFALSVVVIVAFSVVITTGDYSGVNREFAEIVDTGSLETEKYELETFNSVYLFSENYKKQRTLFTKKIPNLKIVNSDEYSVEIKASSALLEKLDVQVVEGILVVTFENKYYNDVVREGRTYRGLFVECEGFEITVYAPVTFLKTDAEITLDYQAPKTENLIIYVSGEVSEAKIYDIDCDYLSAAFCGMSNVTLEGKVQNKAEIEARHNSKVDAEALACKRVRANVTCQLFGFSYINYSYGKEHSLFESGFVVTVILIFMPILFGTLFILFRIKFLRQKKAIDEYIDKAKAEEKYLKIPNKNDENILQNDE